MCLLSYMDSNRCIWTNLNNTPLRLISSGAWHVDDHTFMCFNGVRWIFKRFADSFPNCSRVFHGAWWKVSNKCSRQWSHLINKNLGNIRVSEFLKLKKTVGQGDLTKFWPRFGIVKKSLRYVGTDCLVWKLKICVT